MKKIVLIVLAMIFVSCNKDKKENTGSDSFNRKQMLTFWADKIMIPGYEDYASKTSELDAKVIAFTTTTNEANLELVRESWKKAYISWQKVSLFEVGKARELKLTQNSNLYPIKKDELINRVALGGYDLSHANLIAVQGLPALDYLLYGVANDEASIVVKYNADPKLKKYLNDVSKRLKSLAFEVKKDWKAAYRNSFVAKDGNSDTSSANDVINYFVIRFYEEQLRDYKIGQPAGIKKDYPLSPTEVEAVYCNNLSKQLFQTTLQAADDFFNGVSYDGSEKGQSLKQYLSYLKKDDLSVLINSRLKEAKELSDKLEDSFEVQINDAQKKKSINAVYDVLDKNVISLKTDMMSTMNIGVTISQPADND